jgi:hypothetical protein
MGRAATDDLDLTVAVIWTSLSPYFRPRCRCISDLAVAVSWTSLLLRMATNIKPLSLPPKGVFHSFNALFLSLQEYGILAGCAYITKKSK